MKKALIFISILLYFFVIFSFCDDVLASEKVTLKFFSSTSCKVCIKIKEEYLPGIISKYKDRIEIEYLDIAKQENFKLYLALEEELKVDLKVPTILIGRRCLIGVSQIKSNLEPILENSFLSSQTTKINIEQIDLLKKFRSFSPFAIIAAGLIDGINPCAFTVLIFFISFLALMGYRKRDLATIGITFIIAVFLTYLAIGLGLFRGLYQFRHFYSFLRIAYYCIAAFCFILAFLNLRDFFEYRKTKNYESLKVKLPKSVRSRINAIISMFYRRDKKDKPISKIALVGMSFVVGFLISLLEAICTGQVYLPTIVFILKEQTLCIRALYYLLLYNLMFIVPLLIILLLAIFGMNSKRLEEFFRKKIALVKIFMFILFLGLGIFLLIGA